MGEHKHKVEGREKKAIQPQREEERQSDKQPTEALKRLRKNVARPADVQALKRALGNKTVSNMIQRVQSASARAAAPATIQRHLTDEQWASVVGAKDQFVKSAYQEAKAQKEVSGHAYDGYEKFSDLYKAAKSAKNTKP